MRGRKRNQAFTLVEVILASSLASITMACILQFFLTQLNQYRLISANNKLTESLRIFSKFLEKDVHFSLEFYAYDTFQKAAEGTTPAAENLGNCLLLVQERGRVAGGRGIVYFVGDGVLKNGVAVYPLYRALVSFNSSRQIIETEANLKCLFLGYIKGSSGFNPENNKQGIFYTFNKDTALPGTRHSVYVCLTLTQPGLHGTVSETVANFCFYSRNPRF